MYGILLLQVSAIVSETKTLGWAFLQTVSLPTLKCLVPPGGKKNTKMKKYEVCCAFEIRQIWRSVCIWNKNACYHTHTNLHSIYIRAQKSVWPNSAPTCWSLSFSCLARRCLLFFGPAGRCRAADDADPETPFRGSLSSPPVGSRWGPCSSWNNQQVISLIEVELSLHILYHNFK